MKTARPISAVRRRSGMMLIECVAYIAVFAILLAGGTTAFFYCWDHTRAVIFTADQMESALRAGETWRADVRGATGKISVVTTAAGETVTIPRDGKEIIYQFNGAELRREIPAQNHSRVLLAKVKLSEMQSGRRENVTAWRWELELAPRRKEANLPMRFTFQAAQLKP
jgi:glucan biosynthesis protein